ncbi:MAG: efflux RND transporter periplasmic adaptor subunit [Desulfobulbaceae bacterium]|nr:efflux RND transporter periplasmic adaptor subunit [Desulfobulbaceae bacterium]
MKNKRLSRFACLVAACALLAAGCERQEQAAPGAGAERPAPEVTVVIATSKPTRMNMELPGRASAFRIAEVRPQVGGIILKRLFNEGGKVKAGQLLYQIDPALYQATLASAEAVQAQAEAALHSAKLRAERYRTLVKTKAVSDQEWVDADAALKQAQAGVAAAKAAVKTAKINLDYTQVKAPISGRIGKSMVTEGALVTGQQAAVLATIQQLDPLYVDVTQSSVELLKLEKALGMKNGEQLNREVELLLEDNSPYDHRGTLEFSDVTVEPSTGSVTIRATVPNPDQLLLPGMYLRARLASSQEMDAIAVPQQSVMRDPRGKPLVMVVNAQSLVESRPVSVGQSVGDTIVITNGLKDGDQVVTSGFQRIAAGGSVNIVTVPTKTAEAAHSAQTE